MFLTLSFTVLPRLQLVHEKEEQERRELRKMLMEEAVKEEGKKGKGIKREDDSTPVVRIVTYTVQAICQDFIIHLTGIFNNMA